MAAPAPLQILRARQNGIKLPVRAWREARRAGIEFAALCAFLEKESSGGENVFGHDDSVFSGAGTVTKDKYAAYKQERDALLPDGPRRMQGVGPMQLTWWEFQDRADELGGCWKPGVNVRAGCEVIAGLRRQGLGWWHVAKRYNGADAYANDFLEKLGKWRAVLGAPERSEPDEGAPSDQTRSATPPTPDSEAQ
jgi:hypothetical protein